MACKRPEGTCIMTNDMTTGSPAKLILKFMIPMCLGNIFQQFYNIADSIVAGQFLGVNALAAIGSTGSLIFFVTGWLNGLTSGFSIWVAQWFGAKRLDRMRHFIAMSIYVCLFFIVVMTVGLLILNEPILRLMNAPQELMGDISKYMEIIYAGLLVTCAYNAFSAVLRALGDSRSPLYFLIVSAVLNVVLDIGFIVIFHMGVEGCAYATVIAQGVSAVLCLIYIIKKFDVLRLRKRDFKFSFFIIRKLLALGVPMGLQFSITAIGTIIVQGAINVYGPVFMAGFSAASKIQNIICTVFVSFGATVATFVGQNRGAGKMDRVRKSTRVCLLIDLIVSVFLVIFLVAARAFLFRLFTSDAEVIRIGCDMLLLITPWYVVYVFIEVLAGSLRGAGNVIVPVVITLVGVCIMRIIWLAVVLKVSPTLSSIIFSYPVTWILTALAFILYYIHKEREHARQ